MLYIVSTPIGNLEDISLRALQCLKSCDLILCEDTRHSQKLLNTYEIKKPLVSFHQWNEAKREEEILQELQNGKNIALISDAGTPLVADPGFQLVRSCRENGIAVTAIPGACAAICALTISGFEPTPFQFVGFLPRKGSELVDRLEELLDYPGTSICYESPQRLLDTLETLQKIDASCTVATLRELTKRFETVVTGTVTEVIEQLKKSEVLGEIVLIIKGQKREAKELFSNEFLRLCVEEVMRTQDCSTKSAILLVSEQLKVSKKLVYSAMH